MNSYDWLWAIFGVYVFLSYTLVWWWGNWVDGSKPPQTEDETFNLAFLWALMPILTPIVIWLYLPRWIAFGRRK